MKKFLLFLLIVAAIFAVVSCDDIVLPDDIEASKGLEFEKVSGGYEVVGIGTCKDAIVIIPNTYNGKKVVSIGKGAFKDCDQIITIAIPGNVKTIKSEAFVGCDYLSTIYIQHGVENLKSMLFFSGSGSMTQINTQYAIYYQGTTSEFKKLRSWDVFGGLSRPWYYSGHNTIIFTVYCTDGYLEYNYHELGKEPNFNEYDGDIACPYHVDNNKDYVCDNCKETLPGFQHTHKESDWIIDKEATTTSNGKKHTECTTCGKIIREETTPKIEVSNNASEGLEFTLNDDGKSYSVSGIGNCTDTDIVIPSTYNGMPVMWIEYRAFYNCSFIESVLIPNTVAVIDNQAFRACSNLLMIEFEDNSQLISIGQSAFEDCISLSHIEIPVSVKQIGSWAFKNCALVYTEYDNAFYIGSKDNPYYALISVNSSSQTTYKIHSQTRVIADAAFTNCSALENINVPATVIGIGAGAFGTSVEYINVDPSNSAYKSIDGNVYTIDGKVLTHYAAGKSNSSFNIPQHVTTIGEGAFSGAQSLSNITIPTSVTIIEDAAFSNCDLLEYIIIPKSVKSIGNGAFSNCDSLKSVTFASGSQLQTMGQAVFRLCHLLEEINFGNMIDSWNDVEKGTKWNSQTGYLIVYCTDGTIELGWNN